MSKKITIIIEDEPTALPFPTIIYNTGSACDGCPNNPLNGGSGVCWCTVPMWEQQKYTGSPYVGIVQTTVEV